MLGALDPEEAADIAPLLAGDLAGLEWDELAELLAPLCAAPRLAGLSLGCLNPEKDPGGRCTERTCDLLADALA